MKHISEIMHAVCKEHGITMNQGREMKIEHDGKTFHFERLPNGLLRSYDYGCKWPLLFKKDERGEWKAENLNARTEAYKGLAIKLNATIQPTFSVGEGGEPMI